MKTNYEKLMKINYEKLLIFYLPFTRSVSFYTFPLFLQSVVCNFMQFLSITFDNFLFLRTETNH